MEETIINQFAPLPQYNIAILGYTNSGKKTFVNTYNIGLKRKDNIFTTTVYTNYGEIDVHFHICTTLDEKIYFNGAIVLFNSSIPESRCYVYELNLPKIPVILCESKSDLKNINFLGTSVELFNKFKIFNPDTLFFYISSKSSDNIEKPLLELLRKFHEKDLVFVSKPKTITLKIPEHLFNKMLKFYLKDKIDLKELSQFHLEMKEFVNN